MYYALLFLVSIEYYTLHGVTQRTSREKHSVLIVTSGRSGSSFLGEIFNNHPDVMYYFEPILSKIVAEENIPQSSNRKTEYEQGKKQSINASEYIHDLFTCDASDTVTHILNHPNNMGRRMMSKFMMKKDLCANRYECGKRPFHHINITKLNRLCSEGYSHVVIKELQGRFHTGLKEIIVDRNYKNMKIIQLVRDPRGMLQSMAKVGWILDTQNLVDWDRVESVCNKILGDFNYGNGLKEHIVIRYEDVCENFIPEIQRLLQFVGLSFTKSYRDYLRSLKQNKGGDKIDKPYNLNKNMKGTSDRWRKNISPSFTAGVEKVCGELMDRFGYVKVGNNFNLLNDTKTRLRWKRNPYT